MNSLRKIKKICALLLSLKGIKKLYNYIYFYNQYKVPGYLQIEEGELLYRYSGKPNVKTVVEIGSNKGKSTNFILRSLNEFGKIHCIDPWGSYVLTQDLEDIYEIFKNNLPLDKITQVVIHRGFSYDVKKEWKASDYIDLLFIDGDHSYEAVKQDIEDWVPFVRKGGYVIFHDYANYCPSVQKAAQELLDTRQVEFLEQQQNIFATKKL